MKLIAGAIALACATSYSTFAGAGWGDPLPRGWSEITPSTFDIHTNAVSNEEKTGMSIGRYSECRDTDKGVQCPYIGTGGVGITVVGPAKKSPSNVDISGNDSDAIIAVFRSIVLATDPDRVSSLIGEIKTRSARKLPNGDVSTDAATYTFITGHGSLAVYIVPSSPE